MEETVTVVEIDEETYEEVGAKCHTITVSALDFKTSTSYKLIETVLWIRNILVRIRIRESVPLTYRSGFCFFRQWLQDGNNKKIFKVFLLITFSSVFIDKK